MKLKLHSWPLLQNLLIEVVQHRLHLVDIVVSEGWRQRFRETYQVWIVGFNLIYESANGFKPAIHNSHRTPVRVELHQWNWRILHGSHGGELLWVEELGDDWHWHVSSYFLLLANKRTTLPRSAQLLIPMSFSLFTMIECPSCHPSTPKHHSVH